MQSEGLSNMINSQSTRQRLKQESQRIAGVKTRTVRKEQIELEKQKAVGAIPTTAKRVPLPATTAIRVARKDTYISGETTVDPGTIILETFEDIGGMELLELTRNSSVNGINQKYLPIAGLASMNNRYDPNNIVALQQENLNYFDQFEISLERMLPIIGNGPSGAYVYIDSNTESSNYGNLIIELVGIDDSQTVEIEFLLYQSGLVIQL